MLVDRIKAGFFYGLGGAALGFVFELILRRVWIEPHADSVRPPVLGTFTGGLFFFLLGVAFNSITLSSRAVHRLKYWAIGTVLGLFLGAFVYPMVASGSFVKSNEMFEVTDAPFHKKNGIVWGVVLGGLLGIATSSAQRFLLGATAHSTRDSSFLNAKRRCW